MYKRGNREFVIDMYIACQNILEYTQGLDFKSFLKDKKTIDAVIRNIEILGEATKNVTDELKVEFPEIEWKDIARTRDKIIHFYFGVDLDVVWKIIQHDIPALKEKLEKIIRVKRWENEA